MQCLLRWAEYLCSWVEGVLVVIQGAAGLVAMVGEEGVEVEGEEGLEKAID
jgi:hypothetical protein